MSCSLIRKLREAYLLQNGYIFGKIYIADFCHYRRYFGHEFRKNLQYDFPKMRGGVKGRLKLFRKFIRFGGGRLPLGSCSAVLLSQSSPDLDFDYDWNVACTLSDSICKKNEDNSNCCPNCQHRSLNQLLKIFNNCISETTGLLLFFIGSTLSSSSHLSKILNVLSHFSWQLPP